MKHRLPNFGTSILFCALCLITIGSSAISWATEQNAKRQSQLGPRPLYLIEKMEEGPLKERLRSCASGPFYPTDFSIGHRGAAMQFPEHTVESYSAALNMGAGIVECDATFTKDKALVCRHSQCDLHQTTDILLHPNLVQKCSVPFTPASNGAKATAKCCTSDLTLAEFRTLNGKMDGANNTAQTVAEYLDGTPGWRTNLYANEGQLMTHDESIDLINAHGGKFTPELKSAAVSMPYDGDFTQQDYAQKLVDAYKDKGISPDRVFLQSFNLEDIKYWIKNEPEFGAQAVFLDNRYRAINPEKPATFSPSMTELSHMGVRYLAPPIWMLLALDDTGKIVPSAYAREAKAAGLNLITWTLERSGRLENGGGWYYRTIKDAITHEGDALKVLDILAQKVGVKGVFSDWPATTSYYANCMNLK